MGEKCKKLLQELDQRKKNNLSVINEEDFSQIEEADVKPSLIPAKTVMQSQRLTEKQKHLEKCANKFRAKYMK